MAVKASRTGTKVVTGEVRISFPHLFKPQPQDNGTLKYSVLILIPKSDAGTLKAIQEAQKLALQEGKDKVFGGTIPKSPDLTLHDCDEEDDLEKYPEREGHYRMNVSATENYPPQIVDRNVQPILDPTEVYSGCYVRVSINAFPFKHKAGKRGASFGLLHLQKLRDGERLGGAVTEDAEDVFSPLGDEDGEDSIL